MRWQGNHDITYSHKEPSKLARTVFAIMIAPIIGVHAFVCRLVPVYFL